MEKQSRVKSLVVKKNVAFFAHNEVSQRGMRKIQLPRSGLPQEKLR